MNGVYYQKIAEITASFTIYKNNNGKKLKAKIDILLSKVNITLVLFSLSRAN